MGSHAATKEYNYAGVWGSHEEGIVLLGHSFADKECGQPAPKVVHLGSLTSGCIVAHKLDDKPQLGISTLFSDHINHWSESGYRKAHGGHRCQQRAGEDSASASWSA